MKKTVKRPDGTEETVEGTAEEIAEYERRLSPAPVPEGKEKPAKKKLLTDEVERAGSPFPDVPWCPDVCPRRYPAPPVRWEHEPFCEIVVASRGWWSVVPPRCTCGLITYPSTWFDPMRYTLTSTGTGFDFNPANAPPGVFYGSPGTTDGGVARWYRATS